LWVCMVGASAGPTANPSGGGGGGARVLLWFWGIREGSSGNPLLSEQPMSGCGRGLALENRGGLFAPFGTCLRADFQPGLLDLLPICQKQT
jgi:hypothetical protein